MPPIDYCQLRNAAWAKALSAPNAKVRTAYLELTSFYDRQICRRAGSFPQGDFSSGRALSKFRASVVPCRCGD